MVFIPRDPVMQNQFCTHDSSQGTTASAGQVIYLSGNQLVAVVSGTGNEPYGFLLQSVKSEISGMPAGWRTPADMGSSDAFTGDPVGVAHEGLYDTTQYVLDSAKSTITAGEMLYADVATAKLVNGTNGSDGSSGVAGSGSPAIAVAQNSLSASAITAGTLLRVKLLI